MPNLKPLYNRVLVNRAESLNPGLQMLLQAFRSGNLPSPDPSGDGRIKVKMPWDSGVLPENSAARQHAAPVVRGWDPKNKEPIIGQSGGIRSDISPPRVDLSV
jgi:hypothetical protein